MANKILLGMGTSIGFSSGYSEALSDETFALTLASLGSSAARQSAKADMDTLSVANRYPREFAVTALIEWPSGNAPAAGADVNFYWAPSVSATAATANPGGTTGSDAAYTGTAGSTLPESLLELQSLGTMWTTNDDGVQIVTFKATLPTQFGMVVVENSTDQNLEADGVEMSVIFTPLELEIQ